jgi:UDP-N-acetylmuramoylalanine--D-glutamate ligase
MSNLVSFERVTVVGMAKSGLAAVELCLASGARSVRAVDQRPLEQLGAAGQKLKALGVELLPQTPESLADTDLIVLSPGVPIDAPEVNAARERGIRVIGEVELAGWYLQGFTIGITGSNGKTTTTAMIGHILEASGVPCQVGGNIGTPPASMVKTSRPEQWNVLELSSFQLETIESFWARVAVCTNVTPDHLDRHHTLARYAAAKGRLFETQKPGDFAVLNADDPTCVEYAGKTPAAIIWFSSRRKVNPGAFLRDGRLYVDGQPWIEAGEIPIRGLHNVENTLASALAARAAGAPLDGIAAGVRSFPGVEHRLEFVRELRGVRYYNDSKATNVDATLKAIDAFPGGLWIILGGKDKNSDYTMLREPLRTKARRVLLVGAAAAKIEDQLAGTVPVSHCGTIEKAVEFGAANAASGEIVLLAPACASFDQFTSFEHRGRVFKDLVGAL